MKFPISNFQFPIRNNLSTPKGFTLLELIVVISVVAIISSAGIASFVQYSRAQTLQIVSNEVASILNAARSRAQSQVMPAQSQCATSNSLQGYEVSFFVDPQSMLTTYALYAVCYNQSGQTGGKTTVPVSKNTLPPAIQISSPSLPISFLFNVITSTVATCASYAEVNCNQAVSTSTVTLRNTYNSATKTIQITGNGSVIAN